MAEVLLYVPQWQMDKRPAFQIALQIQYAVPMNNCTWA